VPGRANGLPTEAEWEKAALLEQRHTQIPVGRQCSRLYEAEL
jgi:formylglycine-generating enzyme required for sulfatase activity